MLVVAETKAQARPVDNVLGLWNHSHGVLTDVIAESNPVCHVDTAYLCWTVCKLSITYKKRLRRFRSVLFAVWFLGKLPIECNRVVYMYMLPHF